MKLDLYEIAEVLSAKNDVTQFENVALRNAEFDSRLIESGDLFVPLKGARDGHDFIATAFAQGAVATLSERPVAEGPYILVDDVLTAFQRLAQYYLEKMQVDVLAVTGSNGKTTTKDMLAQLLATSYKTYKTQGNYNNEIGLPYTVLHMPEDTEKLVLEMGQDHLGDIHLLSELAKPKTAIVTLVGEAHLEFFGSRAEIAQGKMQIADGLRENGLLIVPVDKIVNEFLPADCKLVRFGPDADIFLTRLEERKDSLSFECNFLEQRIDLPVTGKYNATNAMIAAYAALQEGVSETAIAQAFSKLELTRNRTEWKKAANGADILSDVYNANPTAMRLILETFSIIPANPGGRKLAVLADMKELGADSKSMHGSMITSLNPEIVTDLFLYGQDMEALYDYAKEIYPPGRVHYFIKNDEKDQFEQLTKAVREKLTPADQILLKGSNSMNLAKLVEDLEDGN
ncbi:UDP-N-acetylmuramoyl-tripeptide--D-alanyl-D-alanine ligase [Streptococcus sp. SG1]|jgi:UDP-N-acetylmuramoyl-tripeptide--D-alanyl-D-alanine ligase|uniref:UDP-N-acetylmuramoyl-tripeptide--D-alanyl-D- alanine ligase n=1 Tax=Streptococcus TaxID=1301 RepID=UPI000F67BCA6|nr:MULTISPECIES: UDP-N-acetylmuramoyl-tripeptide--D-alanyl-D-alanine ligase [Streptococcus]MBS6243685.1 UDP-N-acetylmuramoyl-tripeptide--D-alanyl-D-alanine ligase [Streptococcus sp.]MCB6583817.1 UDP-N-acetylmuramoyl-tripeptide--D-alanyl-D-alanine ligase [Streptococcus gordonii]MCB7052924.1 UDP-N-acetylmuramoyl-tripeptide--D-alanyl-D-alanine ligase [Streptococcus gordonii]MCB7054988.1 UDP-N-acetylmuramoyl-tripeptide--D-alanyl-D-alanine ligase [Streptococcus gordonii]MCC3175691.1 UDP-N-acetylmur